MHNDKVYTGAATALISLSRYSTPEIKDIHE
jgi:hypothetical protein